MFYITIIFHNLTVFMTQFCLPGDICDLCSEPYLLSYELNPAPHCKQQTENELVIKDD